MQRLAELAGDFYNYFLQFILFYSYFLTDFFNSSLTSFCVLNLTFNIVVLHANVSLSSIYTLHGGVW